jgi:hypothetical protein
VQFTAIKRSERRRWKRHSFNVPVRLVTDSAVIDGRGIRMSEGGIYLFSASNLELGEKVEVGFPCGDTESVTRSGIVRYRALYLYGVEFLETPGAAHAAAN